MKITPEITPRDTTPRHPVALLHQSRFPDGWKARPIGFVLVGAPPVDSDLTEPDDLVQAERTETTTPPVNLPGADQATLTDYTQE